MELGLFWDIGVGVILGHWGWGYFGTLGLGLFRDVGAGVIGVGVISGRQGWGYIGTLGLGLFWDVRIRAIFRLASMNFGLCDDYIMTCRSFSELHMSFMARSVRKMAS